ncbi:MAG: 4-hydroxythreonine-4-phosphate dehydrogenase PdxA [Candidatus Aceula meridiana]|nr:4-hydroxythreonine-4-phosphate dehydrogenase PdxA [Candidatus Aceula meridiana]
MPKIKKPNIVITMGDPCGIGPEIIAKALCHPQVNKLGNFHIIGDYQVFSKYAKKPVANTTFLDLKNISKPLEIATVNKKAGQASLEYLDTALSLLKAKKFSALVTGPVCKEAVQMVIPKFKGHTEYLANFFGIKKYDMMFVVDQLKIVVATRHIPLSKVSKAITLKSIYQTIDLTAKSLKTFFKLKNPKIAICGLNPHAGEGGGIGKEEVTTITPAIKKAQRLYPKVLGPFAADTLFCPSALKKFDAVIAMYHDQGLIPTKATSFNKLVNFTIGLPIIRTSPAHGTAFDIVGKNKANPSSMIESIKLAARLAK